MTAHTVENEQYVREYAEIVDAWRGDPGNATIREACESQVQSVRVTSTSRLDFWET